jgi:L-ribulokinase
MANSRFAIGVDYGTNSVRALVVDIGSGEEVSTLVSPYSHGTEGVILDDREPNLARQHPGDYVEGFVRCVGEAVRMADSLPGFSASQVVGLGIDTTGSTPLPVDRDGIPLAMHKEFASEPAAMAWLWKDHTAHAEAAEITKNAAAGGLPYLAKCGGTYSSEWYWSKILRCERTSPKVAAAVYSWVELCDFVTGFVTGRSDPHLMSRSVCAAGHKAMYHHSWGGLPAAAFLEALSPGLARFRERYAARAVPSNQCAGGLETALAARVGLPSGLPVAVGALDAHMGAVGAGIGPGTLVKIMGTSTCDCMVAPLSQDLPDIPGVCGIVPESIVPGMHGIEAGQSAVGDIFNWFVNRVAPMAYGPAPEMHAKLSAAAAKLRPGESGLLALDWHHGNRTILVDPMLTGMMVGETLGTTPAEMYRALIEATAFGALKIIERIESYGVGIDRVVNCGGIAEKSPLVMQIYADVCGRPMYISRSAQTCALGAAIFGSVVGAGHADVASAQRAMTGVKPEVCRPQPGNAEVYRRLYAVYTRLHDAFGTGAGGPVAGVMKELIDIRQRSRERS